MPVYYQFSGFDASGGFPADIADSLRKDLPERKRLVFICSSPALHETTQRYCEVNRSWFEQACLGFSDYQIIDDRCTPEDAKVFASSASCIFLTGGDTLGQSLFLSDYHMDKILCNFDGVIIGLSAGAINMGKTALCSKDKKNEKTLIYDGLGLVDITAEPHFDPQNGELLENELFPLSDMLQIYAVCDGGGIRTGLDTVRYFGEVYLIRKYTLQRL